MVWWRNTKLAEFWGKAGSGILFFCPEDQTVLLVLRSGFVAEPNVWGVPGGAIKGTEGWYGAKELENQPQQFSEDQLWQSAVEEVIEEVGYFPSDYKIEDQTLFQKDNFSFVTFVVSVSLAEKEKMQFKLNWENVGVSWHAVKGVPSMEKLHPGVLFTHNEFFNK